MKVKDLIAEGYSFTQEKSCMDINIIHNFLSKYSTWAVDISKDMVKKSMENSMCFAILHNGSLVGFSRVITDKVTFANLVDVFVLPAHRGKGLSLWITKEVISHPDLTGLRRFTLATTTAKWLYEKFGFKSLSNPETFMEIYVPNIYKNINPISTNVAERQNIQSLEQN
ncbi:MAG: GNAT family N-acetyltransferase [Gammaproteobacteria bacterium]